MSNKRKLPSEDGVGYLWAPRIPDLPKLPTGPPNSSSWPGAPSPASQSKRPRLSSESTSQSQRPSTISRTSSKGEGSSRPPIRKWTSKLDKTTAVMTMLVSEHDKYGLGDFLQHLLDPKAIDRLPDGIKDSLRKWIRGDTREGTRPAEIVDAIYRHPFGIHRVQGRALQHPDFSDLSPPRFPPSFANAHPQQASLLPSKPPEVSSRKLPSERVNSREGLEEWMVRGTLVQVEREAQALTQGDGGLARGAGMTWDLLSDPSNFDQRDTMRLVAPVIWAIMTTITFSRRPATSTTASIQPGSTSNEASAHRAEAEEQGEATGGYRDPTLGIMVAISMLLSFRNPLVNLFQSIAAVFLFACNTHKTVYRAFNRIGISTAHSTLHGHLKELGKSTREALRKLGRNAYESAAGLTQAPHRYFMLIFDNVNKYHTVARKQTVALKNRMKNGTAATAIVLEDVPVGAFDPRPYQDNVKMNSRRALTVETLFDDIDSEHLARVATGMIMRILIAYIPTLPRTLHTAVEERFQDPSKYAKHRLRLRKSATFPLGTSSIEENTPRGVSDVLHDLVGTQMQMQPSWFDSLLVLVGGDQLSVDRLHKAIRFKSSEKTTYESRKWVLPVIQLWHMKLAYLRSIFRVHWFDTVRTRLLGLRHGAEALGRQVNPNVSDFYACHNTVKTVFEAMVLTATFVILEEKVGREPSDHVNHMTVQLGRFFSSGAPFDKCSLEQLEALSYEVYMRYMTTQAYYETLAPSDVLANSDLRSTMCGALEQHLAGTPSSAKTLRSPTHPTTDQTLGNLSLFMRDVFLYLEFASAIPEGDIGRVLEVMKVLRFSFWGSGAPNYGKELLEVACRFKFEYPAELQEAILNNYLVNPSGLNGHWQECDFFQEHSNKAIKTVFNTKNSDWDSPFLRDTVAVNIHGLAQLRESFMRLLGLDGPSQGKSQPDYSADINVLAAHYLQEHAFSLRRGRTQDHTAADMFGAGYDRLGSSILASFIERTTLTNTELADDTEDAPNSDEDEGEDTGIEIPLEPLIMQNGVLMTAEVEIDTELE